MKILRPFYGALVAAALLVTSVPAPAQQSDKKPEAATSTDANNSSDPGSDIHFRRLPSNLWKDQKRIWTSPVHLKAGDLQWMVPLTFAGALAFGSDHSVQHHFAPNASTNHASTLSNAGVAALVGIAGYQYFWGMHKGDDRMHESGFLAGEAALDAYLYSEVAKGIAARERPAEGAGQGRFFDSTHRWGSSFVSQHASISFAVATVIAQEYPGPLTKLFAYGAASGIGVARIAANQHFTSDVLFGSALGYFVGREVYSGHAREAHLDQMYGTFDKAQRTRDPKLMGSTYVPLESWVYPAIDRLRAMGYSTNVIMGMRPWTRKQVAQLVDGLTSYGEPDDPYVAATMKDLQEEFAYEISLLDGAPNVAARLESVYGRVMGISGPPLTDSYHFAQTVYNDYGRPFQEGLNAVSGFSGIADAGPFAFYVRGEYQHAPSTDPYSLATRTGIAFQDRLPMMPGTPIDSIDRLRLLDAYVALNLHDWQLSFGNQSLWWGPAQSTDLMFSNNAEPLPMLRLSNVAPVKLPSLLKYLGNIGNTIFLGQISGYHFLRVGTGFTTIGSWDSYVSPQPYVFGEKFSLQPTENLEIGVSLTTVWAGSGRPATLGTFRHTFSSSGNLQDVEPGDRRTGFDFSYRVPGLRRWLTVYSGSLAEDEPNPIAYPRRSSWNPGLYLSHFPKIPKLDLRIESAYTDIPNLQGTGVTYSNLHYSGGYTNNGVIMGSWIGPEARSILAKSNYWLDAQKKISAFYRTQRLNPVYNEGGNLHDVGASYSFRTRKDIWVDAQVQYEHWDFPLLAPGVHSNVTSAISISWQPTSVGLGLKRK